MAMAHIGLADFDSMFAWLDRSYAQREGLMYWIKVGAGWDPARSDPRFWDYVRKMGLPETGKPPTL